MNKRSVIQTTDRHFWKAGKFQVRLFSTVIITLDFIILQKKKKPPTVEEELRKAAEELNEAAGFLRNSANILKDSSVELGNVQIKPDPAMKEAMHKIISKLEGYNKWKR